MSNCMKIFKWQLSCSKQTDRQIDDSIALRDIAKAPKEWQLYRSLGENPPPLERNVTSLFRHVKHP